MLIVCVLPGLLCIRTHSLCAARPRRHIVCVAWRIQTKLFINFIFMQLF